MADVGTSEIVFQCAYDDGRHGELVLPPGTVKGSTTGGKQEALGFLYRLETARKTIELVPELKTVFGESFADVYVHQICSRLTLIIARTLLDRLVNATGDDLTTIRNSCDRFPYIQLKQDPPKMRIELVKAAFSPELMISHAKKILGPAVKLAYASEQAADWAMSHILAWALEDFAHNEDFRQKVARLSSEEAERTIWNRAWSGPNFIERCGRAWELLADETTIAMLDILDLGHLSIQHLEAIIGLRSSWYYLNIASNAKRRKQPVLHWVTTKYVGLDSSHALAVADTLRTVDWRGIADEPARRRLVLQESIRKRHELDLTLLDFVGGMPGLEGPRTTDWLKCCNQALVAGRDSVVRAPELEAYAVSFDNLGFGAVDTLISLKKAMRKNNLSLLEEQLIYAKLQGFGREEAAGALHVSRNEASAAWRALNRKRERLRSSLMGESKKCPDIRS
jgi:hypothetical protein